MITVNNKSASTIEASVNQWGTSGNISVFQVAAGRKETWDRSDERGFILAIKISGKEQSFLVKYNSTIDVHATVVSIDGQNVTF